MLAARSLNALRVAARPVPRASVRSIHIVNEVGSNTPFDYQNTKSFTIKMVSFLSLGFALPFIACGVSQYKVDNQV